MTLGIKNPTYYPCFYRGSSMIPIAMPSPDDMVLCMVSVLRMPDGLSLHIRQNHIHGIVPSEVINNVALRNLEKSYFNCDAGSLRILRRVSSAGRIINTACSLAALMNDCRILNEVNSRQPFPGCQAWQCIFARPRM
jgi:hypothetical protein